MYNYEWDLQTGGYILTTRITGITKEVRPVFAEELKFLQLDSMYGWIFPDAKGPLMWAEGRRYIYRGQLVAETVGGGLYEMPKLKNVISNLNVQEVDLETMIKKNSGIM